MRNFYLTNRLVTDQTDHKNADVIITYTCGGNQTQIH